MENIKTGKEQLIEMIGEEKAEKYIKIVKAMMSDEENEQVTEEEKTETTK